MTQSGQWPTVSQYLLAVQSPQKAFSDPVLRATRIDASDGGLPDCVQGQNAVVFFGEHRDSRIVIRVLKRPPRAGIAERYIALGSHLAAHPVSAFATTVWIERGVLAADGWRPVIRMEEVGGSPLRSYVERQRGRPDLLVALADSWTNLMEEMARRRVAHGDLQQDNIRVADDGSIRLVDYDGVWAPPVAHLPPAEIGQPNFQHPGRNAAEHWGPAVDLFSAVVVQLSLLAVAADPGLWEYHNAENLVFTGADYRNPMGTAIWHRMAGSRDIRVRELLAVLNQLCRLPVGVELDPVRVLRERKLADHRLPDIVAVNGAPVVWWASGPKTPEPVTAAGSTATTPTPAPNWPSAAASATKAVPASATPAKPVHTPTPTASVSFPVKRRRSRLTLAAVLTLVVLIVIALVESR